MGGGSVVAVVVVVVVVARFGHGGCCCRVGVQEGWTDRRSRVATRHVSGAPAGGVNANCFGGTKRWKKGSTMVRTASSAAG